MTDLNPEQTAELDQIRQANEWRIALAELEKAQAKIEWLKALRDLDDIAQNLYRYVIVDEATVAYSASVKAAVSAFSSDLGIPEPALHFFLPESHGERDYVRKYGHRDWEGFGYHQDIAGLCKQSRDADPVIYVRADMADQWDAISTTAHEVRHASQCLDMDHDEAETDAQAYAVRMTGRG